MNIRPQFGLLALSALTATHMRQCISVGDPSKHYKHL